MDLKAYYSILNDSWKMIRQYAAKLPLSEEDWKDAISDSNRFAQAHGGGIATSLALLVLDVLAQEQKRYEQKKTA